MMGDSVTLRKLQTEIAAFFRSQGSTAEVAELYASEAVRRFAVSPACALDVSGRYLGYPAKPQPEGGWVTAGHLRHVQINVPPEGAFYEVQISVDGVVLTDVTRVALEATANNLVTVRVDRLHLPFQLSDLGAATVDAYLYESAWKQEGDDA